MLLLLYYLNVCSIRCPVPSCRTPKRKVKRLKLLPSKLTEVSPEIRDPIIKELRKWSQNFKVVFSLVSSSCFHLIVGVVTADIILLQPVMSWSFPLLNIICVKKNRHDAVIQVWYLCVHFPNQIFDYFSVSNDGIIKMWLIFWYRTSNVVFPCQIAQKDKSSNPTISDFLTWYTCWVALYRIQNVLQFGPVVWGDTIFSQNTHSFLCHLIFIKLTLLERQYDKNSKYVMLFRLENVGTRQYTTFLQS